MIIAGDIACPTSELGLQMKQVFDNNPGIFSNKAFIFNMEGLISKVSLLDAPTPVLYNHASITGILNSFSPAVACLANNHLLDIPESFSDTQAALRTAGIPYAGAGTTTGEAYTPVEFKDGDAPVVLFNECWDFLLYHQANPSEGLYVATIQFHQLVSRVKKYKQQHSEKVILVYLHWSLDLEILPYPMYRQFSKDLVDAGAAVVAGCHSHCPQGGEKYKEGYIVYGLGNFFLPNHVFANGKLTFPSFAATQLVLEYQPVTKQATCHWFTYQEEGGHHTLQLIESAAFESSALLKKYSPYQQVQDKAYTAYFKKHRRKKMLIPVFKTYHNKGQLAMLTGLLKARASVARTMARMKIIKWQA